MKLNSPGVIQDTQGTLPTSTTNWKIFLQQVIRASELASSLLDQSGPARSHWCFYTSSNFVLISSIRKGRAEPDPVCDSSIQEAEAGKPWLQSQPEKPRAAPPNHTSECYHRITSDTVWDRCWRLLVSQLRCCLTLPSKSTICIWQSLQFSEASNWQGTDVHFWTSLIPGGETPLSDHKNKRDVRKTEMSKLEAENT